MKQLNKNPQRSTKKTCRATVITLNTRIGGRILVRLKDVIADDKKLCSRIVIEGRRFTLGNLKIGNAVQFEADVSYKSNKYRLFNPRNVRVLKRLELYEKEKRRLINELRIEFPDVKTKEELYDRIYDHNGHLVNLDPFLKTGKIDRANKLTMNHLRHNCTNYDKIRIDMDTTLHPRVYGHVNEMIKNMINSEMIKQFPFLKHAG